MFYAFDTVPIPPTLNLNTQQIADQGEKKRFEDALNKRQNIINTIQKLANNTIPEGFSAKDFNEQFGCSIDLVCSSVRNWN